MDYRTLETTDQFDQVVEIELAVWGLAPRDCVPSSMIRALTHAGGVAHGAYEGSTMVGMALAFPALHDGTLILWSHMAGVLPAYQGQDVGFNLKQTQREWALAHGFDEIGWTFDPLRRGNANFNLHRLGAASNTYHVNFYGEMKDALNQGTPSDRLEVRWKLSDPRVASLARERAPDEVLSIQTENILLKDGTVRVEALSTEAALLYAEIPSSLDGTLNTNAWRLALRQALQQAFAHGYTAADFVSASNRCWYVLRHL